ncbi:MAG: cytochrome c oxidase assembly protein, partial [Acidimicrobiia bacterium]|nr:cytochrome c oxidase assembly protein [Acidimicrobiia bacterium]
FDPARATPRLFAPIPASVLELIVVWLWHVPAFHYAARHHQTALVLEQATFLAAGLFLWLAAAAGDSRQSTARAAAGIGGLLFTSIHMTLLGALFALAPRLLYDHAASDVAGASALDDQHLGGAIMLLVGGVSYLAGGLWLAARLVRTPSLGHEATS